MTTIPDGMPSLAAGSHKPGEGEVCVMEMVSILAGEPFTDTPSCTHPILSSAAQQVNDALPDGDRHLLVPLIGRLFGTAETGTDLERLQVSTLLAVWCAREVADLVRDQDKAVCVAAVDAAEKWALEPSKENATVAANAAASAYAAASATNSNAAATYAAYAAASATNAAATYAAYAAASATNAAATNTAAYAARAAATYAARSSRLVAFLTGLLDEYDRITDRSETRVLTEVEYRVLASAVTG